MIHSHSLRSRLALSAGAMALAVLLAVPPLASAAGTLVWARYDDIDSLDPHRATSTLSMQVWDQIYETLLSFDDQGRPQPHVA
ncbi:MAG: hypothetical protein R3337_08790, partial [Gammaproteobacteria bacterium]|nr:hypothetical protein [Gammaproteobacteria bacterium]